MKKISLLSTALLLATSNAHAFSSGLEKTGYDVLSTICYSLLGLFMAVLAYKVIDLLTPGDLNKEIIDEHNVAAGIIVGSLVLGVCIIIAAVMAN